MKKGRLLIVEDEEDLREILRDALSDIAVETYTASNGAEALQFLNDNMVDAIVSDINMPQKTGLELLKTIRQNGNTVPFIVLTGFGDQEKTLEALKLGAFDFLDKPWDEDKLLDVISRALEMGELLNLMKGDQDILEHATQIMSNHSEQSASQLQNKTSQGK